MQINTKFDYLLKLPVGGTDVFDNSEGKEYAPSSRPAYEKITYAISLINKQQGEVQFVLRAKDDTITVHRISDGKQVINPPAIDRSNNIGGRPDRKSPFKQRPRRSYTRKVAPPAPAPQVDVAAIVAAEVAKALGGVPGMALKKREPRTLWAAIDQSGVFGATLHVTRPKVAASTNVEIIELIEVLP